MCVYLYSGTPGSGKSYESVIKAFNNLKLGKFVIANFAINFTDSEIRKGYDKKFFYMPGEEITIESLIRFAVKNDMIQKMQEHQCMVIVDEAGGRYNVSRTKDKQEVEEMKQWRDFFSQHMKLGFDFILVAQSDQMLDRQIRKMIESEFRFRQINNYSVFKYLPFKVFVKIEFWYVNKQRVGAEYIFFRKKWANRYNRFKMFSGFKLSEELLKLIEGIQEECENGDKTMKSSIMKIFKEDTGEKE